MPQIVTGKQFILHARLNQAYLAIGLSASTIIWVIFKILYPWPNLIFDSYQYTMAAVSHAQVHLWPIGYSKFLLLASLIAHSANWIVSLQYFLLQFTLLYFLFTVRFVFRLSAGASHLLFLAYLLNPLYVFTSNFLISDTLFTVCGLLWLVQLFQLILHPRTSLLLTHTLLICCLFSIRYNGLFYPFVSVVAFLLSNTRVRFKIAGIGLQFLAIGSFILFSTYAMKQATGKSHFSTFSGWRLANNALYMYEHVYPKTANPVPDSLKELDSTVNSFFHKPHDTTLVTFPDITSGGNYMFLGKSPLTVYMARKYGKGGYVADFRKYSQVASLYKTYGACLIRQHPIAYCRYFVLPNTANYLLPLSEIYTQDYGPNTLSHDSVARPAIRWFHLTTITPPVAHTMFRVHLFSYYSIISPVIHIFFLLLSICFLFQKDYRTLSPAVKKCLLLVGCFWLLDFLFSITASTVVLRLQMTTMTIEITFILYLADRLFKKQVV